MKARKQRKIAVVGTTPSQKDAPIWNYDWEIWTCNRAGLSLGRWDRLFEIHRIWDYESPEAKADYLKKLGEVKPPKIVVSIVPIPGVKSGVILDREKLFAKHGSVWFSSSIAYELACAIDEKPDEIGIWGVDMESTEEYLGQFPACDHFVRVARASGIKVTLPTDCTLLRQPSPYPDRFETIQALVLEKKAALVTKLIADHEAELEIEIADAAQTDGYMDAMRRYDAPAGDFELWRTLRKKESRRIADRRATINRLHGELTATRFYQHLFVWNAVPPELKDQLSTANIKEAK